MFKGPLKKIKRKLHTTGKPDIVRIKKFSVYTKILLKQYHFTYTTRHVHTYNSN